MSWRTRGLCVIIYQIKFLNRNELIFYKFIINLIRNDIWYTSYINGERVMPCLDYQSIGRDPTINDWC